jgi:hypothetical protein
MDAKIIPFPQREEPAEDLVWIDGNVGFQPVADLRRRRGLPATWIEAALRDEAAELAEQTVDGQLPYGVDLNEPDWDMSAQEYTVWNLRYGCWQVD